MLLREEENEQLKMTSEYTEYMKHLAYELRSSGHEFMDSFYSILRIAERIERWDWLGTEHRCFMEKCHMMRHEVECFFEQIEAYGAAIQEKATEFEKWESNPNPKRPLYSDLSPAVKARLEKMLGKTSRKAMMG